jgi:hypothetical protein
MRRTVDRTFDPEIDTRFVAEVSALGALADDVVTDVIRARAGRSRLSQCAAVEQAADLVSFISTYPVGSADDWSHKRPADSMRWLSRLKEPAAERTIEHGDDSEPVSIAELNADLQAAITDGATPGQLDRISRFFTLLSESTLVAAQGAVYGRASRSRG